MGQKHFEQMWLDAVDVDRRAMALAVRFMLGNELERKIFGHSFWTTVPADVIMENCRAANRNEDQYHDDLKQLLVARKTEVIARRISDGAVVKIHDPNIIDYDVETMSEEKFFEAMMAMPIPNQA